MTISGSGRGTEERGHECPEHLVGSIGLRAQECEQSTHREERLMVRKRHGLAGRSTPKRFAGRVDALGLGPVAEAAGETPVYLVGGAVRDLLLGREPLDLDLAVEGDAIALARPVCGPGGRPRRSTSASAPRPSASAGAR